MDNKAYWKKRIENALILSDKNVNRPLKALYRNAFNNIKNELVNIWLDMVNESEVSQSALYQRNRMANLQALLSKELYKLGETNIEYLQTALYNTFQEGYTNMSEFLGIASTFSFLDEPIAKEIIKQNYKGAVFSERVWKDMDKLKIQIENVVTKSALQGEDIRKVSRELQERMNVSFSDSKRITVTETGRVFNESARVKAMNNGYRTYSILLETNACEDCVRSFKGKHFDINESVLPKHPNCKCAILIDINANFL